jgi:acetyl esterase/lipase
LRRHKPTAHISYEQGLEIVRAFLKHVSYHTVEDLQTFTSQKIPTPHWVKTQEEEIPQTYLKQAAEALIHELGPKGILRVGGKEWWQWRGPTDGLRGEWIEMKSDYHARLREDNIKGNRVMLYVHGGGYFFGSIDTHRYQIQRHARKLKARVFARFDLSFFI